MFLKMKQAIANLAMKGAPEAVFKVCKLPEDVLKEVQNVLDELTEKGLQSIRCGPV
jgi:magnesium-transporting ATPase (P-type)